MLCGVFLAPQYPFEGKDGLQNITLTKGEDK